MNTQACRILGIDIGGANLKFSDGTVSRSVPFALWQTPELLSSALESEAAAFGEIDAFAITMTGELADCFRTRSEGVHYIVDAVEHVASGRMSAYWCTSGEFLQADHAKEFPNLVAAANWHALATWAGRICPTGHALLVDVGSTTCDVIPIENGIPCSTGLTDFERLQSGELTYQGMKRTPICALLDSFLLDGMTTPVARELFATTLDTALLRGDIPENETDLNTANGKPATIQYATDRLARMLCSDTDDVSKEDLLTFADTIYERQLQLLIASIQSVAKPLLESVLISGEGEYLARAALTSIEQTDAEIISMTNVLDAKHSSAACAYALVQIFGERLVP